MEIDECSNAVGLTIFPEEKEKQPGHCIGSTSDKLGCKYRMELESGICVFFIYI